MMSRTKPSTASMTLNDMIMSLIRKNPWMTYTEIAKRVGKSQAFVSTVALANGEPPRTHHRKVDYAALRAHLDVTDNIHETARAFNVTVETVHGIALHQSKAATSPTRAVTTAVKPATARGTKHPCDAATQLILADVLATLAQVAAQMASGTAA